MSNGPRIGPHASIIDTLSHNLRIVQSTFRSTPTRAIMLVVKWFAGWVAALGVCTCAWGQAGFELDLRDSQGRVHPTAEVGSAKATVFAFISPECPISNAYIPELNRIAREYAGRGARMFGVHSDPKVTASAAQAHAAKFGIGFPVLLDGGQRLARRLGATRTLEVAVVLPDGRRAYLGRVDDRTPDFGQTRPRPRRQDLRLALDQVLAGKPVTVAVTRSIGCAIPFPPPVAVRPAVSWVQVAPILFRHCARCHRPGESGPFALLRYSDAAPRADLIAKLTARRYMPPWLPKAGYGRFIGERRLGTAEIATLAAWAKAGAPEGDRTTPPRVPAFTSGWQKGKPDLVTGMTAAFPIPADGPDRYRCFVLPLGVDRDRFVTGIEIRPGARREAHHALLFQDLTGTARRRDHGDGYDCFGTPGFLPARGLGGWTPGSQPVEMPPGVPEVLHRGADLVLQIHYHPTGRPEGDRTEVGLYFTEQAPRRRLTDIPLGSTAIDIAPGDKTFVARDHFTVPVDVDVLAVFPHAHYVCKDMKAVAVLPDGRRKWLFWIPNWDFNWQQQYRYRAPVRLPSGTDIQMIYTYDNSADNPRNPNQPPRRVVYGPGSTDEMAGLHLSVTPVDPEDAEELGQALWGKMMRSIGRARRY